MAVIFFLFWNLFGGLFLDSFDNGISNPLCLCLNCFLVFMAVEHNQDVFFLIAGAQAALIGIVVPVITAFRDINDPLPLHDARQALYRQGRFSLVFWSSFGLIFLCGISEAFLRDTTALYFSVVLLFRINLILLARLFFISLFRSNQAKISVMVDANIKEIEGYVGQNELRGLED